MATQHAKSVVFLASLLALALPSVDARADEQASAQPSSLFVLKTYRQNYILPLYYTDPQDQAFFEPANPNKNPLKREGIEFQLSLRVAAAENLLRNHDSLQFAYTQNSFWQAYDKSAYFRDTDYQPELFYTLPLGYRWGNWHLKSISTGFWHESNGRGGDQERSWNRIYLSALVQNGGFSIELKPWTRVRFTGRDYNKDITHYRGDEEITLKYQLGRQSFRLLSRNNISSGFSRGYEELDWVFPLYKNLAGYLKFTSGYGQSISSYNFYNNSAGVGVTFLSSAL